MAEAAIRLEKGPRESTFMEEVMKVLPQGGNLSMCLTCGACSSGCPATGIEGMDPRKFLRMAALGLDEEAIKTPWVWSCTQCRRCVYACPMSIDIPRLVFNARGRWPREERPKGIRDSCDQALKNEGHSAMGAGTEDFKFVVEDVLEEVRENQPRFKDLQVSIDKQGAEYFLNQNSREPVMEPDEMVPLWKILHMAGADWTYGVKGWAAENYCMFLSDDAGWRQIVENKAQAVDELGIRYWLNTE